MDNKAKKQNHGYQTRFSFGSTSAIITNLGLIAGLHSGPNPKLGIISGILVIAIADNISDSFGIHIFQESQKIKTWEVWMSTVSNFLTRVLVSATFIFLLVMLPLNVAIASSIVWGLALLAVISYVIAKDKEVNPYSAVMTHVLIATVVILLSNLVGDLILRRLRI